MRFSPLTVEGAYAIDLEPFHDDRGTFARAFCEEEFSDHGLTLPVAQANLSHNPTAGTLRGLHYQVAPALEAKFVRAVRGALYDVVLDVRESSPTYGSWDGVEIDSETGRAVYVPEGCAHGFLTLVDDTTAYYQVSAPYTPGTERGVRWNDPAFGIEWPRVPRLISEKDANWPLTGRDR